MKLRRLLAPVALWARRRKSGLEPHPIMKTTLRSAVLVPPLFCLSALLLTSGCFTSYHTERRLAVIEFVNNPSIPSGVSLEVQPIQKELKALLKTHDLLLSTDRKRAQWVAYVDATFPAHSEDPLNLRLVTVNFNPDRVSPTSIPAEARRSQPPDHPSFKLAEQLERTAQSAANSPD